MGADAVFEAVVDRPQLQGGLHVPPAAFDLQQLLVAQRDVLRGQVRVGAAQQVLPVQVRLDRDLGLSMWSSPPGVVRRKRLSPGMVEIRPRSSARFVGASWSLSAIRAVSLPTMISRSAASRSACSSYSRSRTAHRRRCEPV